MSRFIEYLNDTRTELGHASWPTRRQAIVSTILVVAISILVGIFIGLFDFAFTKGLNWFILK